MGKHRIKPNYRRRVPRLPDLRGLREEEMKSICSFAQILRDSAA
jgi:hypothetical protein